MKFFIGLTGPTGAGKSIVSSVAKDFGFTVIDCDLCARNAANKGKSGLLALTKAFGDEILNADGSLNRTALAKTAFSSPEKTDLLNKTFLPFVIKEVLEMVGDSKKILLDAPTLFESGLDSECNITIAVLADTQVRLDRIIKRDNISKDDALLRISAGKSDDFYKKNADYIIYNNDEITSFKDQFAKIINSL